MIEPITLALATCQEYPDLTEDDRLLLPHFEARGLRAEPLIWNDPATDTKAPTILLRSTWDYYLEPRQFQKWLDEMDESGRRLLNPTETVRWNIDKTYLLELNWAGIPCFPSLLLKRGEKPVGLLREIRELGWLELVIKPTISAGSYLTFRIDTASPDLPARLSEIQKHSDVLVQPFAPEIVHEGEASLIFFRTAAGDVSFSHSVVKRPRENDFRVQADFGGQTESCEVLQAAFDVAYQTLDAVPGPWVYARVDLFGWSREPLLSEIELIEPSLYLAHHPNAAKNFLETLVTHLK